MNQQNQKSSDKKKPTMEEAYQFHLMKIIEIVHFSSKVAGKSTLVNIQTAVPRDLLNGYNNNKIALDKAYANFSAKIQK